MLPEPLSNGLCSLMPKVDRLAMVCEMNISGAGRVTGYRFFEAVIRSAARLTYTQVGAFFEDQDSGRGPSPAVASLAPQLRSLRALYNALWAEREQRGALSILAGRKRASYSMRLGAWLTWHR